MSFLNRYAESIKSFGFLELILTLLTTSRMLSRRVSSSWAEYKTKVSKNVLWGVNHGSLLHTLSIAALSGTCRSLHKTRHSTVLLYAEWLITTIPGGLGLNKSQSHLLRLKSAFPQGIALSQIPSIMHQNLHHKSQPKELSVRCDEEQSTAGREAEQQPKKKRIPG